MIQRIQTIWLSLCAILSLFLLTGPFLTFTGKSQELLYLSFKGLSSVSANGAQLVISSIIIPALIIIIPVLSLLGIILYRKRPLQKIAVCFLLGASVVLCIAEGYYWNLVAGKFNGTLLPGLKMIFPVFIIILAILAYLGIRKDENIVKSYDRLR